MKMKFFLLSIIILFSGITNCLKAIDSPTLLAPANGSFTWNYVVLDWSLVGAGNAYHLQLDTVSTFDSQVLVDTVIATFVGFDGTTILDGLYFGTEYNWRIKAYTPTDTSAWSSSWTFNTRDDVVLVGPADASENYARVMLNWDAHPGITYYDFEIDTINSFNSSVLIAGSNYYFSQTNATYDSEENINTLYFGANYFWRVRARNDIDTSAWTNGFFTTKDFVELNSPANAAQVPVGVLIDWNAFDGVNFYDYEVDSNPNFASSNLISGSKFFFSFDDNNTDTEMFIDDIYFGTGYYWRVRARHALDVSEWVQGTFTTTNTIMLSSPSAGSMQDLIVDFDWQPHAGVDVYQYQVDESPLFNSTSLIEGTDAYINAFDGNDDTHQELGTFNYDGDYYWRVRAWNAVDTSEWSQVNNFTTNSIVQQLSPLPFASTYTELTFEWEPIEGSTLYELYVDTSELMNSSALLAFAIPGASQSISNFMFGSAYFWKVRAINTTDTSEWSSVRKFYTRDQVGLVSPLNEALSQNTSGVTLDWLSHHGAISYDFQMDTTNAFNSSFLINQNISYAGTDPNGSDTEYQTGLLATDKVYFWRVRAQSEVDTSKWEARWFSTGAQMLVLPEVPTLVYPLLGEIDVSTEPELDWDDVAGASAYYYQFSTQADLDGSTEYPATASQQTILALDYVTQYYWRVRSFDGNLVSDWSATYSFTTAQEVLEVPVLLLPLDNSINLTNVNLDFDWEDVYHAQAYLLQMATDDGFVFNNTIQQVNTSSAIISGIMPDSDYFWRVKAISDTLVNGAWSETWTFSTIGVLEVPYLVNPLNNSFGLPYDDVNLTWYPVAYGQSYEIEYAQDPLFNYDYHNEITNTSYFLIEDLEPETGYYWRARAKNDTLLTSNWSDTWTFETMQDTTTSIGEINASSLKVYPNPVANSLYVRDAENRSIQQVSVFNALGKMVVTKPVKAQETVVNMSELKAGIYQVVIYYENDQKANRKIVVLR